MTQSLSGHFLSQLVQKLTNVNAGTLSLSDLATQLAELLNDPATLVEIEDSLFDKDSVNLGKFPYHRFGTMDAGSRATLNTLLPWSSYNVANKMPLGGAYLPQKRASPHLVPDTKSFSEVGHLIGADSTVLEVGCFEGHYTATLAQHCQRVYAFDSRVENVLKTLVRSWALGMDRKVSVDVLNIETDDVLEFYRQRDVGCFDLVYHRGVLYHLSDPVAHLANIAPLCKTLYLNTQYASDEQATSEVSGAHGNFRVYNYREKSVDFAPFAGMVPTAQWLRKVELLNLLERLGFRSIAVTGDTDERNGKRIALVASK